MTVSDVQAASERLLEAARKGNLAEIEAAFEDGADPNYIKRSEGDFPSETTPLAAAIDSLFDADVDIFDSPAEASAQTLACVKRILQEPNVNPDLMFLYEINDDLYLPYYRHTALGKLASTYLVHCADIFRSIEAGSALEEDVQNNLAAIFSLLIRHPEVNLNKAEGGSDIHHLVNFYERAIANTTSPLANDLETEYTSALNIVLQDAIFDDFRLRPSLLRVIIDSNKTQFTAEQIDKSVEFLLAEKQPDERDAARIAKLEAMKSEVGKEPSAKGISR